MRIAVAFDSPYSGWTPAQHMAQMEKDFENWANVEPDQEYQIGEALLKLKHDVLFLGFQSVDELIRPLADFQPDLVFNATETFRGNAKLEYLAPALLESEGYRYTGAPPAALLITRNKAMSKKILAYHGINVPRFTSYRPGEPPPTETSLRFPVIVKPLQADASEGISQASIVRDHATLVERVTWIHERFTQPAICEEYIEGRELYATMVGNGDNIEILPIVEMTFDGTRPEDRIATANAKWDFAYRERKGIKNVFARPLARTARAQLDEACRTAFRTLWLRDFGRLDVRLDAEGQIWFLEANANPFLSYGHDSAEAAHKAGMNYHTFLQRIVDEAMAREP